MYEVQQMTQTINIRIDSELKKQAEKLFKDMGMNMSTAFTIFVRQSVRQRKIPFEVNAGPIIRAGYPVPPGEENDPFYSEENLRHLQESIKEIEEGKVIVKTMGELAEMEK
jgi:DNA-damage-inducible protein J